MPTMLLAALLMLPGQQAGGPSAAPPGEPRIVVAAPIYHPDGAVSGETSTLSASAPSVVFVFSRKSICDTATTSATEPRDAGFGWRVAANIVSATATDVSVSVDWRRVWDHGKPIANGPSGHAELTMHAGDRIPLDLISNGQPTDACRAVGMGLEVRLGRTAAPPDVNRVTLPLAAKEGGAGQLDVDLWLVHTTPGGGEQALHQKVRLTSTGGPFTFAPVKFSTSQGEVGIELNGVFQRYTSASGGQFLLLGMSRTVTGAATPAGGLSGNTSSFVPLPNPADVLSFEMTTGGVRGGAAGGRGRGGGGAVGGAGGGPGGAVLATPPPVGAGAFGSGGGQRGGGGGGGARSRGGGEGAAAGALIDPARLEAAKNAMQIAAILDGHRFALRVRVTPVPGS